MVATDQTNNWTLKTEVSLFNFDAFTGLDGDVFSPEVRLQYNLAHNTYVYGAVEGIVFLGKNPQ